MKKLFSTFFHNNFIPYFPYLLVFIFSLYHPGDSDMGWHLKYGEYFFQHFRILYDNAFSTMMPDFHWANASWGTDLITYAVFKSFSFPGLSILGALTVTFTFYFFSKAAKLTFWEQSLIFPILIFLEEPLNIVAFRGQQLSLLGIGILFFILSRYEQNFKLSVTSRRKKLYPIVALFLLWANIHGEFLLALAIFLGWIVTHILRLYSETKDRKLVTSETKFMALLFFFTFMVTFINPFGLGIHLDALLHFGNPLMKYIVEYLPFDLLSSYWWRLAVWAGLVFIAIGVLWFEKLFLGKLPFILLLLFALFMSFLVRRYTWPMFYMSLPVLQPLISSLKPLNNKIALFIASCLFLSFYVYSIFYHIPQQRLTTMSWQRYCQEYVSCSAESAQYLVDNKLPEPILTFYNWGGWLIYNYPRLKPSIDGRMHLWRDEGGYSAFEKYYALEQGWANADKSEYNTIYITPTKPLFKKMTDLVRAGKWKTVYSDSYASIFVRK